MAAGQFALKDSTPFTNKSTQISSGQYSSGCARLSHVQYSSGCACASHLSHVLCTYKSTQIGSGNGLACFGQGDEKDISGCLQSLGPYKFLSKRPEECPRPCQQ